jgi:hypothetical protein
MISEQYPHRPIGLGLTVKQKRSCCSTTSAMIAPTTDAYKFPFSGRKARVSLASLSSKFSNFRFCILPHSTRTA